MAPRARALAAAALVTTCALALGQGSPDAAAVREDAYRANNRGVALLEQYQAEAAVKAFRDALALDPKNTLARINLAIALLNVPDFEAADTAASAALEAVPNSPQAWYVRGLVARSQNRTTEAAAAFTKVLAADAADVGARVNLGQLALLSRDYEKAITQFKAATEAEPYNGTALYNLGIALVRAGRPAEGQKALDHFQALKEMGAATMIGQNYPEQGRYAEAVLSTGDEADLVDTKSRRCASSRSRRSWGSLPGWPRASLAAHSSSTGTRTTPSTCSWPATTGPVAACCGSMKTGAASSWTSRLPAACRRRSRRLRAWLPTWTTTTTWTWCY